MPRRAPLALLLALAATAILVAPANALTIHQHRMVPRVVGGVDAGPPIVTKREIVRVKNVAPGDSDDDGCPDPKDSYTGPGCNAPPPVTAPVSTSVASTAATTSVGSASAIPSYIVACESGGDYSAVNPSSGAYGAYQILPSTSAAYGCDMSTPAGQDACAAEIYADVGTSAWVCG